MIIYLIERRYQDAYIKFCSSNGRFNTSEKNQ